METSAQTNFMVKFHHPKNKYAVWKILKYSSEPENINYEVGTDMSQRGEK